MRPAVIVALPLVLGGCADTAPRRAEVSADLAPQVQTAGETPFGRAVVGVEPQLRQAVWTISYANLSGAPTAISLDGPSGDTITVTVAPSPILGGAVLTLQQAESVLAGRWSVTVRTAAHPQGELRGKLTNGR